MSKWRRVFSSREQRVAVALVLALLASACALRPGTRQVCRLTPLHTGACRLGADHVLGGGHSAEERIPFVIYAFLVESASGEKALVDLGPKSLDYTNRMFRRHGFFRDLGAGALAGERYPDDVVQPHGNVFAHLDRLGIEPAEIGHIVFTHLHADHHGMDDAQNGGAAEAFGGALLHVSAAGWNDNLRRRRGERWNSYVDYAFGDFLVRRERERQTRFADDADVFPGLRTMYLGGHSPCSQAVIVETASGPAIITSDEIYRYDLLERGVFARIYTSLDALRAATDALVDLAVESDGILVPLHEPLVWQAYQEAGDRWLDVLAPISARAIRGYLETREARKD